MIALLLAACHDAGSSPSDAASTPGSDSGTEPATGTSPTGTTASTDDTDSTDATGSTTSGEPDPDVVNEIPPDYVPQDPVRVIYLGDSITAGYGASDPSEKYTALLQQNSAQWPGFDAVDLESSWPDLTEFDDVSVPGATTDTMLRQQLPALEKALAFPASGETIVVFTIGGNDLQTALLPLSNAAKIVDGALANFGEIADWFLDPAKFPDGVYVYATNVYEPSDGIGKSSCFFGIDYSDDLDQLDRFNDSLAAMGADKGFAVLDLHGHFSGHGYHHDDSTVFGYDPDDATLWFASDCIHPNDRGHHEIRRLFHAAITGGTFTYRLPE